MTSRSPRTISKFCRCWFVNVENKNAYARYPVILKRQLHGGHFTSYLQLAMFCLLYKTNLSVYTNIYIGLSHPARFAATQGCISSDELYRKRRFCNLIPRLLKSACNNVPQEHQSNEKQSLLTYYRYFID